MPIDLYHIPASAPCRSVRLAAAALGVDLNLKVVDLMAGEQLKPEFIKMNPEHKVPTMDDNGFYLWESRAIMTYLVNKYGKNDSLYPKDPAKRAVVDQRLYFDMGTLYQVYSDYYYPFLFTGVKQDQTKYEKIGNALSVLDKILESEKYTAGKTLTLADLALVVTVSNIKVMDYDMSKYKNVLRWYAKIESEAPKYKEIQESGLNDYKAFVDKMMKKP